MNKPWGLYCNTENVHVIPIDDLDEHVESENCKCEPTLVDRKVFNHHAFDKREYFEIDNIKIDKGFS